MSKKTKSYKIAIVVVASLCISFSLAYLLPSYSLPSFLNSVPRIYYYLVISLTILWFAVPEMKEAIFTDNVYNVEPAIVDTSYEMNQFGVTWKVIKGANRPDPTKKEMIFHVEGPLCPDCGVLLDNTSKDILWFKRFYWFCESCERKFHRPKQHLFEEQKVVLSKAQKLLR